MKTHISVWHTARRTGFDSRTIFKDAVTECPFAHIEWRAQWLQGWNEADGMFKRAREDLFPFLFS